MYIMKSITLLISNLYSSGGTQRMVSLLCNALIEEYEINILVNNIIEKPFYPLDDRVNVVDISKDKDDFFRRSIRIYNFLQKHKSDFYINIDTNSVLYYSLFLPKHTKLIIWEHFSLENNYKKLHFTLSRIYASYRSHRLVVLSEFEKSLWYKRYKTPLRKIDVIYNPIPLNVHSEDSQNKHNNKTIIAIGNNIEVKGFDLLLKAWKNLKTEWSLKIIGLPELEKNKLVDYITIEGIRNVKVFGRESDISSFYKNASIFVLSSRKEAAPLVLLESQAFGLPVIAFDHISSVKEISGDSVFFVPYREKEKALKDAICSLINSENLYLDYYKKSIENTRRFTINNFIKSWKEILT